MNKKMKVVISFFILVEIGCYIIYNNQSSGFPISIYCSSPNSDWCRMLKEAYNNAYYTNRIQPWITAMIIIGIIIIILAMIAYYQSISDKPTKKGKNLIRKHMKLYSILCICAIISAGILTTLYLIPLSIPPYINTAGWVNGVYISGDYAYVADGESGLAIINVSNPLNPGSPSYINTLGESNNVFVSGDYAYVAEGESGLAIIDISNPLNPGSPSYINTTGRANGVFASGHFVYVANGESGLAIINVSNPLNPGSPSYINTDGISYNVFVSGDYAYVADGESGLAIIDISNPLNPGSPLYKNTLGWAYDVFISGDYAYVADDEGGLAIIDILDPLNPGIPHHIYTTSETISKARGVFVAGDYVYVADYNGELAIILISDPLNPGSPSCIDTQGYPNDVFVSGDYAYIADVESGLTIIDVSDTYSEIKLYNLNHSIILVGLVISMIFATLMIFLISYSLIANKISNNSSRIDLKKKFGNKENGTY